MEGFLFLFYFLKKFYSVKFEEKNKQKTKQEQQIQDMFVNHEHVPGEDHGHIFCTSGKPLLK